MRTKSPTITKHAARNFLLRQNEHKYAAGVVGAAEYEEKKATLGAACGKYLGDYLARRKVNLALVKKCLALYEEKIIDKFVIPQDDSSPYGYTAVDQAEIRKLIREKGLHADIYPGADETGLTLLAAAVCVSRAFAENMPRLPGRKL